MAMVSISYRATRYFLQDSQAIAYFSAVAVAPNAISAATSDRMAVVHFALQINMARIRRVRRHDGIRTTLTGRLAASDMGRLEHACAPALTDRAAALDIDLRAVKEASARAVLVRIGLRERTLSTPPDLVTPPSLASGVLAAHGRDTP
jgi:hypothetical protein